MSPSCFLFFLLASRALLASAYRRSTASLLEGDDDEGNTSYLEAHPIVNASATVNVSGAMSGTVQPTRPQADAEPLPLTVLAELASGSVRPAQPVRRTSLEMPPFDEAWPWSMHIGQSGEVAAASLQAEVSAAATEVSALGPGETDIIGRAFSAQWAALKRRGADQSQRLFDWASGIDPVSWLPLLCMAGTIIQQVSPLGQVRKWERLGTTGDADVAPYLAVGVAGLLWCVFGLSAWLQTRRHDALAVLLCNWPGVFLGAYYTYTFYVTCRDRECLDRLQWYCLAVLAVAFFEVSAYLGLPADGCLAIFSLTATISTGVSAVAMLVTVPQVVQSEDSESIAGTIVVANLVCTLAWCMRGWMAYDLMVLGPNLFALLANLCCLYLKITYPARPMDAEKLGITVLDPSKAALAAMSMGDRARINDAS